MPGENGITNEADNSSLSPNLEEERPPRSPLLSVSPISPTNPGSITQKSLKSPLRSPLSHRHFLGRPSSRSAVVESPGDRFRSIVRKVMRLRRTSTWLASRGVGAEPGVDPRRESATLAYGHIKEKCLIEVCDYNSVRSSFGRMTNKEFIDFINDPVASAKEPWVKVRWVNIAGISWDVLSAVGIKYDLHPLAVEDVLHSASRRRSKIDYYPKHLFLCVLCHSLARDGEVVLIHPPPLDRSTFTNLPRSSSPVSFTEKDKNISDEITDNKEEERTIYEPSTPVPRKGLARFLSDVEKGSADKFGWSRLGSTQKIARDQRVKEAISVQEFKKGDRVSVKVRPICIFLTRGGTVISINPTNDHYFTAPISGRLRQRDTVLRTSADPSLLVQSLLDLIVDQGMEVVDEYQGKILKLEHDVLLKPKVKTIRSLHILSGDLILHKRTFEPVKTIINGLRQYDLDRCAALVENDDKVEGFMSQKAKIYLADVFDHAEYILTSLDVCAGIAQNLIDFSFNMASHDMNEVMRRLTLATIIFLPLTLLTGYFGMNFPHMWSLFGQGGHSDLVFWIISLPIMAIILPIFLREDIVKMVHYVKKSAAAQNAIKLYKYKQA